MCNTGSSFRGRTTLEASRKEAKTSGKPFYFTGKVCKNGHISKRYVSGGCVVCKIEASGAVSRGRRNKWGRRYKETENGTITVLLSAAKKRALKKSQDFSLNREWVAERVSRGVCEATGLPFVLTLDDAVSRNPWRPSIDRVDPALGYTQKNCRLVVALFNFAKNEFRDEDVLAMARAFVEKCRTRP